MGGVEERGRGGKERGMGQEREGDGEEKWRWDTVRMRVEASE